VEKVLMKLDGETVAPICHDEIHHAHREVEYHIIADELREALQTGQAEGDVGEMNTDTICADESDRARREVVARAVVAELDSAVAKRDTHAVREFLAQAKSSPIARTESAHKTMDKAESFLETVDDCKEDLPMAMATAYNVPALLTSVLEEADNVGYVSPEVKKALKLHDEIKQITLEAQQALASLDKDRMRAALEKLERNELMIPEADRMKQLLRMSETQLLQEQLITAVKEDDSKRVALITRRMKEIYFYQHGYVDFGLTKFPRLKTPAQFASRELTRDSNMDHMHTWDSVHKALDEERKGMLTYQATPLHTSLTHLPTRVSNKASIHAFSVFNSFISEDAPKGVDQALAHVLHTAVVQPGLRDELYIQVIKQMTNNPSTMSIIKAWKLFELLLMTFPPSEDFENFLEAFIRNRHNSETRLLKLHLVLYEGRKPGYDAPEEKIYKMVREYKQASTR
jgi:hypothetical protein